MRRVLLLILLAAACGGETKEEPPPVDDKCPTLEKLAGKWVRVAGSAGDTNNRFEIRAEGDGSYTGTFILGSFDRIQAKGKVRKNDVVFTQVLDGEQLKEFNHGRHMQRRIHIEPRPRKCSLRVTHIGLVKKAGKVTEQSLPGRDEYLPFPDGQPFSFEACTGHLFLRKAALKSKIANWEISRNGGPTRSHQLGKKIPVGVWTDAKSDGDQSCTFDMDLWFDDRPMEGKQAIPAGKVDKVDKGKRRWFIKEWPAPYSGNHHFQAYRYKTCGKKRELIGVNCIDAVLHP